MNDISPNAAFQTNQSSTETSQKLNAFNMHGHALLPTLSLTHYMEKKARRMCTKLPWEQPKSSVGCVIPSPTYVPATGVEPWIRHAGAGPRGGKAGLERRRSTHWHQNTIPFQSYVWGEDRPQGKPGDHELTYRLWDTTRLEERLGKDPKGFGNP